MSATPMGRRTETVLLFHDDDQAAIDAARRRFDEVMGATPPQRLGDKPELDVAAGAYDETMATATERAVKVTVQSLLRKKYREVLAACPPRDDNDGDAELGYDFDLFTDGLLEYFDLETGDRTIIEPEFKTKNELIAWLEGLSAGYAKQIFMAAFRVNEGGSPDPKASLTSQLARLSAVTSTSPRRMG